MNHRRWSTSCNAWNTRSTSCCGSRPRSLSATKPCPRRVGSEAPAAGAGTGLVILYLNPTLPQALRLPARVAGEQQVGTSRVVRLPFVGLSEAVVDGIEKFIFRHHRRLVAGSKQAPS